MVKLTTRLVNEVEALCRVHVGKHAESEQWRETCNRLSRLDKLVKQIRRQQVKADKGTPTRCPK